jgi:hypothetical protein
MDCHGGYLARIKPILVRRLAGSTLIPRALVVVVVVVVV